MQLENPSNGYTAKINKDGQLYTITQNASTEHHVNHSKGEAYNALFAVNPDGAGDCIFYLKNNDNTDLIIEGVWWQTSAAEEVYYKLGDTGTAVKTNGADITPANLNAGSGNIADVTCYSNTSDGAVDITEISGGTTIQSLWLSDTKSVLFNCEQDIVVHKNQVFTIYCVGGDTNIRGTVIFNFHDSEL